MLLKTCLVIVAIMRCAAATNFCFFRPANNVCDTSQDHVCCNNFGEGGCCQTTSPHCGIFSVDDILEDDEIYSYFGQTGCGGSLQVEGDREGCFAASAVTAGCSMHWIVGDAARRRSEATGSCVEPDYASYTTAEGVKREIFIPQGNFSSVSSMLVNKDYAGLAAFKDYVKA